MQFMSHQQEDMFSEVLPASKEDRNLLSNYIKEVSGYLDQINKIKEEIKDATEVATSKDGKLQLPKKEFSLMIKAYREKSKMEAQAQAIHCALDDISMLNLS